MTSLEESKYLLEHLLSLALTKGYDCTQKDAQFKELNAKYERLEIDSRLRDQLLEQMLQDSGVSLHVDRDSKLRL